MAEKNACRLKISSNVSFAKREIPPFVKGGQEGFGFLPLSSLWAS
jgi:hypothetical protein